MKKIILTIGVILIIFSLYSLIPFIFNYIDLSDYDRGKIVGFLIFLVIGNILIYYGMKLKK